MAGRFVLWLRRGILWIGWCGLYALAVLTILIIAITRFFKKRPNRKLYVTLVIQLLFAILLIPSVFQGIALRLNFFLYQDQREAVVKQIQHGELKPVIEFGIFPEPYSVNAIELPAAYSNTVNRIDRIPGKKPVKYISGSRNCKDEMSVLFEVDQQFMGNRYAVMYSIAPPHNNHSIKSNADNPTKIERDDYLTVEGYKVNKVLKKNWYYVVIPDGLFHNMFKGMFNGSSFRGCRPGNGNASVRTSGDCD